MSRLGRTPTGPRGYRRLLHVAARTAAALAALLVLTAAPASAHNVLEGTSPKDGATVARVPAQVVLTFDNPALQPGTALVVTGPRGPVQTGPPRLVNDTVAQSLAPGSPAGRYRVAWRATSIDGHPVSGTFAFTATAARPGMFSAPVPAATTPAAGGSSAGRWVVAVLVLLGAAVAVAWRSRVRR